MRSTIMLKVWMALSGLFLVLFLVVHMVGNLQLFLPASIARGSFNTYSAVLSSSIVIKVAGWFTYGAVVGHAVVSALLTRHNRAAGARTYGMEDAGASSPWYARSMGTLGVITLAFLVLHMQSFWYRYHWGPIGLDANGNKDLYKVVVAAFSQPWIVVIYVVSMVALGFHLQHGIAASLRSLGVSSARVARVVPRASAWVAWGLAGPFAAMPIYVFIVATAGGSTP